MTGPWCLSCRGNGSTAELRSIVLTQAPMPVSFHCQACPYVTSVVGHRKVKYIALDYELPPVIQFRASVCSLSEAVTRTIMISLLLDKPIPLRGPQGSNKEAPVQVLLHAHRLACIGLRVVLRSHPPPGPAVVAFLSKQKNKTKCG